MTASTSATIPSPSEIEIEEAIEARVLHLRPWYEELEEDTEYYERVSE